MSSSSPLDSSCDGEEIADLTSVIGEFRNNDDEPGKIPVKKLQPSFDNIAKDEHLKVYLRVRPVIGLTESSIRVVSDTSITTIAPESSNRAKYTKTEERDYSFSRVFGTTSSQQDVFTHAVAPLVDKFLGHESCVLFAYGMTNSGKTFTIQGTPQIRGVLPNLIASVLDRTESFSERSLQISMMEIYQEKVFDLLSKQRDKLQIRDNGGRVEVSRLSCHALKSPDDAFKLVEQATQNRSKSSTLLNSGSSRSHAIYSLILSHKVQGQELSSTFHIVDLAGAERQNRTKATIAQQKEGNSINVSLMQLWRCMKRKTGDSSDIVPYRESKLTHILMPVLSRAGANGVTMITCVNPRPEDYDETISILGNASIACTIREIADVTKNIPVVKPIPERFNRVAKEVAALESKKRKANEIVMNKNNQNQDLIKGSKISVDFAISGIDQISSSSVSFESVVGEEQELKRLRIEVEKLQEEKSNLLDRLVSVEQEVRMEVAEELAKFAQINNDHCIYQPEVMIVRECPKSTTKMKKQHLEEAWKERLADAKELEDELELVRTEYNTKILELNSENDELRREVELWRNKYETVLKFHSSPKLTSAISTSPGKCSGSVILTTNSSHSLNTNLSGPLTTHNVNNPVSASAADSFNQRMARFKKNASNAVANGMAFAENLKPTAIMSVIKEDTEGDEVLDENGYYSSTSSKSGKKQPTSTGLSSGSTGTAGLRLRSHTLRGVQ